MGQYDIDEILTDMGDQEKGKPEIIGGPKSGWGVFDEEVAWFLYDFFRFRLNGYEKLIFYSYYINGLTLEELGKACDKHTQAMSLEVIKINKKLRQTWKTKKTWRVNPDECAHTDKRDRPRDQD
jgi:hypothetical protein